MIQIFILLTILVLVVTVLYSYLFNTVCTNLRLGTSMSLKNLKSLVFAGFLLHPPENARLWWKVLPFPEEVQNTHTDTHTHTKKKKKKNEQ